MNVGNRTDQVGAVDRNASKPSGWCGYGTHGVAHPYGLIQATCTDGTCRYEATELSARAAIGGEACLITGTLQGVSGYVTAVYEIRYRSVEAEADHNPDPVARGYPEGYRVQRHDDGPVTYYHEDDCDIWFGDD